MSLFSNLLFMLGGWWRQPCETMGRTKEWWGQWEDGKDNKRMMGTLGHVKGCWNLFLEKFKKCQGNDENMGRYWATSKKWWETLCSTKNTIGQHWEDGNQHWTNVDGGQKEVNLNQICLG